MIRNMSRRIRTAVALRLRAMLVGALAFGCRSAATEVAPLPFTPAPDIPMARRIPQLERVIRSEMERENVPGLEIGASA